MVEKTEMITGVIKGALVKAVNSGDYLTLTKGGKDYNIFLASVAAPKMGSSSRVEEPFGFDAREFLRERYIGKKCDFNPEYNFGGRDYGTLLIGGTEDAGVEIVKAGLAKVVEKKGALPASSHYDELVAAQTEAKGKKINLHATGDQKYLDKHTRKNVTYFSEAGYSAPKLLEESKAIDKPLEAIVEYVFNASYLTVYIHKFQTVAKFSMNFLFTPDSNFIAEGKAFVEKLLLHRTVGVKLERFEPGGAEGAPGNLYGRLFHPAGDIAYEVLKNGFAKLNAPKNTEFDTEYYRSLKEAQLIAQSKQLRLWKDFKMGGGAGEEKQKPSTTDFVGRVVEIHSGDSLTVEREGDF
jgi:staphylococcal nuclease domain-containing protein 1